MPSRYPPRLLFSALTGKVYVVTRYTEKPSSKPGKSIILASTKHDVSADFDEVVKARAKYLRSQKKSNKKLSQWAGVLAG